MNGHGKQLLVGQLIMKRLSRPAIMDGRDGSRPSMMPTAMPIQELTCHVYAIQNVRDHRTN